MCQNGIFFERADGNALTIVKNYYLCLYFVPPYKVNGYGKGHESAT